jgi:hypothetical protein
VTSLEEADLRQRIMARGILVPVSDALDSRTLSPRVTEGAPIFGVAHLTLDAVPDPNSFNTHGFVSDFRFPFAGVVTLSAPAQFCVLADRALVPAPEADLR